jgi:hypothetical protein
VRSDSYTIAEAARRIGLSKQRVGQLVKDGGPLIPVEGADPLRIEADGVEKLRAQNLAKFDDVMDLSNLPTGVRVDAAQLEVRAERAESLLRAHAASHELISEGIRKIRQGEQTLTDMTLTGLPDPR